MQNFKISIPKPCHEDWQEMTPQDKGRFCGVCSKIVVDFSVMTEKEIIHFFQNHQNEKVCGHIKKTQLERIYEPQNFLEKHYMHIHKAYKSSWLRNGYLSVLSSLLLLTGCQKEEKVGDVEAIKTEVKKDSIIKNDKCIKDSLASETLDGNVEIIESERLRGELITNTPEQINPSQAKDSNSIFQPFEVSEDASFEGGISNFREILQKEVVYPEMAKKRGTEGKVYLQFIVNQEGKIENIKVLKDLGDGCREAAIKAIENVAKKYTFKNAQGQAVKVKKVIPVDFKI